MNNFQEWYAANLKVGGYPKPRELDEDGRLRSVDVFINVSDEYNQDIKWQIEGFFASSHWFPLGEAWGLCLGSIYGAMYVLWLAEQAGQKVYLHCHAGVNRSQTVADCYYYLRTGEHRPLQFTMLGTDPDTRNQLQRNCENKVLPDLFTMEGWLKNMAYAVSHPMGGWLDASREQAGMPMVHGT